MLFQLSKKKRCKDRPSSLLPFYCVPARLRRQPMLSVRVLFALSCLGLLGCAPSPSTGGLKLCRSDNECKSGFMCLLNVCTSTSLLEQRHTPMDGPRPDAGEPIVSEVEHRPDRELLPEEQQVTVEEAVKTEWSGDSSDRAACQPSLESCNGKDDNCDGKVDETFPGAGDSCPIPGQRGPCADGKKVCEAGQIVCKTSYQKKAEECGNGKDDDCDGVVDGPPCKCKPGSTQSCFSGAGGKVGVGICKEGLQTCTTNSDWGACIGQVLPGKELCNGADDNCDGAVDETFPEDGQACQGSGLGECKEGTRNCTLGKLECKTNTPLAESCNGKDDDCNGKIDDAFATQGDACLVTGKLGICKDGKITRCDNGTPVCESTLQATAESCNGKDDNCNGAVDETFPQVNQACKVPAKKGLCEAGKLQCVMGLETCVSSYVPVAETCGDGLDNNCDGQVDELPCTCTPNTQRSCYSGDLMTRFRSPCQEGTQTCGANGVWGSCVGESLPQAESCNGKDDDCDGYVDEGRVDVAQTCSALSGNTLCKKGIYVCNKGSRACEIPSVETLVYGRINNFQEGRVGPCKQALFDEPRALVRDSKGNLYVADFKHNTIRKIDRAGTVSVFAGNSRGTGGTADGQGTSARFSGPSGLAIDSKDNLYVADFLSHRIRKIDPAGNVSTLAGQSSAGLQDGVGTQAKFNGPFDIAISPQGDLFVVDLYNQRIRKVTQTGNVSIYAGSGYGYQDGGALTAKFANPSGVAVDAAGVLYVADRGNHSIRKITPTGMVSTFVGNTSAGYKDDTGGAARFDSPIRLTFSPQGDLYVSELYNHLIRKVTPAGVVSTFAGEQSSYRAGGYVNSTLRYAKFRSVYGLLVGAKGELYVADHGNDLIRIIENGTVRTFAGAINPSGLMVDGESSCAFVISPERVMLDKDHLYIADSGQHAVLKVNKYGELRVLAGGGRSGYRDGPAQEALFDEPLDFVFDASKNMFIVDRSNDVIRKLEPNGTVTTFAGNGSPGFKDGKGKSAQFYAPYGIAIGKNGHLYVADSYNHRIREIAPDGTVTTFAGTGSAGRLNGARLQATFNRPLSLVFDGAGNLFVLEFAAHRIRKIDTAGNVSFFVGSDTGGSGSLDALGTNARLALPWFLTMGPTGDIFFCGDGNDSIRKADAAGNVTTVAGRSGFAGNVDKADLLARFSNPHGIAIDSAGNMYIADNGNRSIRFVPTCPP